MHFVSCLTNPCLPLVSITEGPQGQCQLWWFTRIHRTQSKCYMHGPCVFGQKETVTVRKGERVESRRNQMQASSSVECFSLPGTRHDNTCEVLPTREVHPSLSVPEFFVRVMQAWSNGLPKISSVSSHLRGQSDTVWYEVWVEQKQIFTINALVSKNYLVAKAPGTQRRSYQAGHPRARTYLPVVSQGPVLATSEGADLLSPLLCSLRDFCIILKAMWFSYLY